MAEAGGANTLANAVALVAMLPELPCDESTIDPNLVMVADHQLIDSGRVALAAFSSVDLSASLAPIEALVRCTA
jgi:hypothetical protein